MREPMIAPSLSPAPPSLLLLGDANLPGLEAVAAADPHVPGDANDRAASHAVVHALAQVAGGHVGVLPPLLQEARGVRRAVLLPHRQAGLLGAPPHGDGLLAAGLLREPLRLHVPADGRQAAPPHEGVRVHGVAVGADWLHVHLLGLLVLVVVALRLRWLLHFILSATFHTAPGDPDGVLRRRVAGWVRRGPQHAGVLALAEGPDPVRDVRLAAMHVAGTRRQAATPPGRGGEGAEDVQGAALLARWVGLRGEAPALAVIVEPLAFLHGDRPAGRRRGEQRGGQQPGKQECARHRGASGGGARREGGAKDLAEQRCALQLVGFAARTA
mmetsp:Transcript_12001/g.27220  ORF Transcript_12001/g.27220 Transcript_12001/m.27220 type:complete len:328 (-) Transcript_12001:8-991(-)